MVLRVAVPFGDSVPHQPGCNQLDTSLDKRVLRSYRIQAFEPYRVVTAPFGGRYHLTAHRSHQTTATSPVRLRSVSPDPRIHGICQWWSDCGLHHQIQTQPRLLTPYIEIRDLILQSGLLQWPDQTWGFQIPKG